MEVYVDFTIYYGESSLPFGVVTGCIPVPKLPGLGENILFYRPLFDGVLYPPISGFRASLSVVLVKIELGDPGRVLLSLDDVFVDSLKEAKKVGDYFEKGFRLIVEC